MIKFLQAERFGVPSEVISLKETSFEAEPSQGQALVAVLASPINPSDLLQIRGFYGVRPQLPSVFGNEGVGRVLKLGPDSGGLEVGGYVLFRPGTPVWAQQVLVSCSTLVPLPPGRDPIQLSMLGTNPVTAYALLHDYIKLQPDAWIIHNGANSAVGRWITALAVQSGIHVVNVVRSEAAAEQLRRLGTVTVLVDGPDLSKRVASATQGSRIELALDCIGGEATRTLISSCSPGATVVLYGGMSGQPAVVPPGEIIFKNKIVRGYWLLPWLDKTSIDRLRHICRELLEVLDQGKIKIQVANAFELDDYRDAFAKAESGTMKVLFTPNGPP